MRPSPLFLWAWGLFPLLFPFYLLPSGLPQPGDIVMAALLIVLLPSLGVGIPRDLRRPITAGFWFVVYTTLVSASYVAFDPDGSSAMMWAPVYYGYDLLVFATCVSLHAWFGPRFLRVALWTIGGALVMQVLVTFVVEPHSTGRGAGSFNNPNQLGYFALLSATCLLLIAKRLRTRAVVPAAFLVAAFYLAALSLSKAAIFSLAVLVVFVFVRRPVVTVTLLALLAIAYVLGDPTTLLQDVETRLTYEQSDDNIAARGLDRLWEYPEYLVFGAGEGQYERFPSASGSAEIHSTLGTLLFAYGVVGTALFGAMIWQIYRRAGTRTTSYLVPAFLYGLTHQGLRFTLFWVALAVVASLGRERAPPRGATPRHTARGPPRGRS